MLIPIILSQSLCHVSAPNCPATASRTLYWYLGLTRSNLVLTHSDLVLTHAWFVILYTCHHLIGPRSAMSATSYWGVSTDTSYWHVSLPPRTDCVTDATCRSPIGCRPAPRTNMSAPPPRTCNKCQSLVLNAPPPRGSLPLVSRQMTSACGTHWSTSGPGRVWKRVGSVLDTGPGRVATWTTHGVPRGTKY